jgi:hypothetical protein
MISSFLLWLLQVQLVGPLLSFSISFTHYLSLISWLQPFTMKFIDLLPVAAAVAVAGAEPLPGNFKDGG